MAGMFAFPLKKQSSAPKMQTFQHKIKEKKQKRNSPPQRVPPKGFPEGN